MVLIGTKWQKEIQSKLQVKDMAQFSLCFSKMLLGTKEYDFFISLNCQGIRISYIYIHIRINRDPPMYVLVPGERVDVVHQLYDQPDVVRHLYADVPTLRITHLCAGAEIPRRARGQHSDNSRRRNSVNPGSRKHVNTTCPCVALWVMSSSQGYRKPVGNGLCILIPGGRADSGFYRGLLKPLGMYSATGN